MVAPRGRRQPGVRGERASSSSASGPSFTVDTLEHLAAEARDGLEPDLWFMLSAEAFGRLPTWHEPERSC